MISIDSEKHEMRVDAYSTNDVEIVGYFSGVPEEELPQRLERVMKTGVVALMTVGTSEKVDYVRRHFDELKHEFDKCMSDAFGEKGQFASIIDEHFGEDGRFVKELLDPDRVGTPLARLRDMIDSRFQDLRRDLKVAETAEEISKRTTLKGGDFESVFDEMICEIVKPLGDTVERRGTSPGAVLNSKKGDFVAKVDNRDDIRIVFETKDTTRMSLQNIEAEVKEAIANRIAVYGVFVARTMETLPKTLDWFNEVKDDTLVVALGDGTDVEVERKMLRICYKWARTKALTAKAREVKGFDIKAVEVQIMEARRSIASFKDIKGLCTKSKEAVELLEDKIETVQTSLEGILDSMTEQILRAESAART